MWRYLAGGASALALVGAGVFLSREIASQEPLIPDAPAASAGADAGGGDARAPVASEKSKEEKRFNRHDKDKNGVVAREEYLLSRRKAYAKLDADGNGTLSFDEYAVKTREKFAKADADKSTGLSRVEFATTKPVRKAKPACRCAPAAKLPTAVPQPETSSEEADDA